jgi:hypothetical protein
VRTPIAESPAWLLLSTAHSYLASIEINGPGHVFDRSDQTVTESRLALWKSYLPADRGGGHVFDRLGAIVNDAALNPSVPKIGIIERKMLQAPDAATRDITNLIAPHATVWIDQNTIRNPLPPPAFLFGGTIVNPPLHPLANGMEFQGVRLKRTRSTSSRMNFTTCHCPEG